MRHHRLHALALALASVCLVALGAPSLAAASHRQISIIQDGVQLAHDPDGTMQTFRKLGAGYVRVIVPWSFIAPDPTAKHKPSFDATDPAAYPAANWSEWDAIDRAAARYGLTLDFDVSGGAPRWAEGSGIPPQIIGNRERAWKPSASEFGKFVQAIARRYDGSYPDPLSPGNPLPRVGFWSIWNEANFGEDLAPQAIKGSTVSVAPGMYRNIIAATWNALHRTGHGHDKIVIGGFSARGMKSPATKSNPAGHPGDFAQTKPLEFIRTLYCVDAKFRELRGSLAKAEGCPTTAAGSRSFRSKNPGLFDAGGFAQHPYPQYLPPTEDNSTDPDFASFSELPRMWRELDRVVRIYGSHTRYSIYNDEYGYITNPPNHGHYVSPTTAAYYINWAEYLSWKSSRIASYMQFPLADPAPSPNLPEAGGFSSGLETWRLIKKPAFDAYRMPLYLPSAKIKRGRAAEIWGGLRPAPYMRLDTGSAQVIQIQFQRGSSGSFTTLASLTINDPRGYFDLRTTLPASGTVRLAWTYPSTDPLLPTDALGVTVYSRSQKVRVT
jgi:hypothetical protein